VVGAFTTVTARLPVLDPQLLLIESVTLPETEELPHVVVIEFVPWPEVMVTPVGTVQL